MMAQQAHPGVNPRAGTATRARPASIGGLRRALRRLLTAIALWSCVDAGLALSGCVGAPALPPCDQAALGRAVLNYEAEALPIVHAGACSAFAHDLEHCPALAAARQARDAAEKAACP